jgi:hypothetical protein
MDLVLDDQSNRDAAEELNRLLEMGKLLASVLTETEMASLRLLMESSDPQQADFIKVELGNTSVT